MPEITLHLPWSTVVLKVIGPEFRLPLSGLRAVPVEVKSATGPYYCPGFHLVGQ